VLIQALALLLFSATAIGATRVQERYPALAAAGVVTSAIGVQLASAGIWSRWWESGHETLWRWMWAFVVLPLVISHVSGLLARLRETDRPAVHTVTRLTVLAAGILGALIVVPVVAHAHVESGYVRFAGVFVILDVLGTLVVPILRRAARGA
jgi:cytochrome bd-type quinol oxidase subunit 2